MENHIKEIQEKLKRKLHETVKSQDKLIESMQSIKEIKESLEITSYDCIDSNDYLEILEHKFKKTMGLFSIFVHNLKCLKSKNALGYFFCFKHLKIFLRRKKIQSSP